MEVECILPHKQRTQMVLLNEENQFSKNYIYSKLPIVTLFVITTALLSQKCFGP